MTNLIFYHYPCMDGKAAAWVAYQYFKKLSNKIVFFGVDPSKVESTLFEPLYDYTDEHPNENFKVYCLDISLGIESYSLLKFNNKIDEFTIIDHHQTGLESMLTKYKHEDFLPKNYIFDLKESGATLAWKYFFPEQTIIPQSLEYIKDRDIWEWKLPSSKAVNEGIGAMLSIGKVDEFSNWDLWMSESEKNLDKALIVGLVLMKKTQNSLPNLSKDGLLVKDPNGLNVFVLNTTTLTSEYGNYICLQKNEDESWFCDYCVMWRYSYPKKCFYLSLRSNKDRNIDVSQVAKNLTPTGGGHRCASGCSLEKLPEWMNI